MSKSDNKQLEEAINFLEKMLKEYKAFGDLHNPEFEDTEKIYKQIETVLKELEKVKEENKNLKNEKAQKFLDVKNYYKYNNAVDTLNKFIKDINVQMHPVTTKAYREEIKYAIKNIIENIRITINIETLKEKQEEIERLKKENNKLERANKTYINSIQSITPVLLEDYIEKDKIKEKIEEQKELMEKYLKAKEYGQVDIRLYKIAILEELR